jgi:hypothetical protein
MITYNAELAERAERSDRLCGFGDFCVERRDLIHG